MNKKKGKFTLTNEHGQDLAEFAIVLPLLLLVVFGVLDLGRVFHAAIAITNAAREGARYAMVYPSDIDDIRAVARGEAQNSGIDLSTSPIDVSCPEGSCASGSGKPIRVTVQYEFTFMLVGFVFPDPNWTITRSAEMIVP